MSDGRPRTWIHYVQERETYLERAGRAGSKHTRLAYRAALERLEAWCAPRGISPLELTPASADDWIESMKAEDLAPSSVHLWVAASSFFWTWLAVRGTEPGGLFWQARKGGRLLHRGMTGDVVWRLIEKKAKMAGGGPTSLRTI